MHEHVAHVSASSVDSLTALALSWSVDFVTLSFRLFTTLVFGHVKRGYLGWGDQIHASGRFWGTARMHRLLVPKSCTGTLVRICLNKSEWFCKMNV